MLSLSSFTLIKRLFSSSLLSAIRVVLFVYLRLLLFLPPILITACNSSFPAFLMMYSAYRLNKQGDSRQPCLTPFSILNQSVAPYRVLLLLLDPHSDISRLKLTGYNVYHIFIYGIYIYICIYNIYVYIYVYIYYIYKYIYIWYYNIYIYIW